MKLNKFGFSLAEIMVATGILGVVSLGTVQIMQTNSRQARKYIVSGAERDVINKIKSYLRNPDSCTESLKGIIANSGSVAVDALPAICTFPPTPSNAVGTAGIKNAAGVLQFERCKRVSERSTSDISKEMVTIGSIYLKKFMTSSDTLELEYTETSSVSATSVTSYSGNAVVEVELITATWGRAKARGALTIGNRVSRKHDIVVNLNLLASGAIHSCYKANVYAEAACSAAGGTIDPASGRCNSTELCFEGKCFTAWPKLQKTATCTDRFICLDGEFAAGFNLAAQKISCCEYYIEKGSFSH